MAADSLSSSPLQPTMYMKMIQVQGLLLPSFKNMVVYFPLQEGVGLGGVEGAGMAGRPNLGGHVLGYIKAERSNHIIIGRRSPRSTILSLNHLRFVNLIQRA